MQKIKTRDDSFTLRSEEYDENYHSLSGALEEAEKKYTEPCKIKEGSVILDIGFGLGYNPGMAILKAKKAKITFGTLFSALVKAYEKTFNKLDERSKNQLKVIFSNILSKYQKKY